MRSLNNSLNFKEWLRAYKLAGQRLLSEISAVGKVSIINFGGLLKERFDFHINCLKYFRGMFFDRGLFHITLREACKWVKSGAQMLHAVVGGGWVPLSASGCVRTPLLGDSSFTQSVMYNTRALRQPSEIPEDDDVGSPEIIIWCCWVSTLQVVNLFKECCWKGSAWLKDIQINWLYFFPLLLLDTSLSDCGNTGQGRPFELLWPRPYFCMPHCMNP